MTRAIRWFVAAWIAGSVPTPLAAQPAPTHPDVVEPAPVRLLVGLPPGGGVDQVARLLADGMARKLGRPVVVPQTAETTAVGAAYLAGIGAGAWTIDQTSALWHEAARYEPAMAPGERGRLLEGWRRAVDRSRNWASAGSV